MLTDLSLQNFRNHQERQFVLSQQTVIVGPNGAGKTNILEAIAMLSLTTSWKTERDSEVVNWDSPFARVVSGERELVIQRHPYYKRIRIDGLSKRVGEVVGTQPSVLFQPDDSALIYGAPAYRRAALDRLLSQTVPGYMRTLSQLQKVLKHRNKLLKQIQEREASEDQLAYWDEQLAADSAIIHAARREAVPELNEGIVRYFAELIEDDLGVRMEYHQSPRHAEEAPSFLHHIEQNRQKEIAAGTTLYGPHREDLIFFWGEHPAAEGMSRGQVRALVLAFKLAEVEYIEKHTELAPLLLLDDVFSEFDEERRRRVLGLAKTHQTILTATDAAGITMGENSLLISLTPAP
jgi:DNA replication and repair protein RecF